MVSAAFRAVPAASLAVILSCAVAPRLAIPQLPVEDSPPEPRQYMSRQEIFGVMERSSVHYEVEEVPLVRGIDLARIYECEVTIDPRTTVQGKDGGGVELVLENPPTGIASQIGRGESLIAAGRYAQALEILQEANRIDSRYFRTQTLIARACCGLARYDTAMVYGRRAVGMNPLDANAHQAIGRAARARALEDTAFVHLTYAYTLNRFDTTVEQSLSELLADRGQRIDRSRWLLPVAIEKVDDRRITCLFEAGEGENWTPLACCLACWEMEPRFQNRAIAHQQSSYRLQTYKECLLAQVGAIRKLVEEGKPVDKRAMRLREVADAGMLNALLWWEIALSRNPELVFLLSEDDRARLVAYVQRFVFGSI